MTSYDLLTQLSGIKGVHNAAIFSVDGKILHHMNEGDACSVVASLVPELYQNQLSLMRFIHRGEISSSVIEYENGMFMAVIAKEDLGDYILMIRLESKHVLGRVRTVLKSLFSISH